MGNPRLDSIDIYIYIYTFHDKCKFASKKCQWVDHGEEPIKGYCRYLANDYREEPRQVRTCKKIKTWED